MSDFKPTHVISTATKRRYVCAVPADHGGQALYTEEEWETCTNADWEIDDLGNLCFQGTPSQLTASPGVATIEPFEECRWTRTDGWNDDGTRIVPGTRSVAEPPGGSLTS